MEFLFLDILAMKSRGICKMSKVVVADASCLIILSKIGELDILNLVFESDFRVSTSVLNDILDAAGE